MNGMWTKAEISGKPADVYEPPARPQFGVLYLHDAGGTTLAGNPTYTRLFAENDLACVCPRGGPSWWTDRVCPDFDSVVSAEKYLLQSVVPFFQERWGMGPRAIGLLGVSMGGQGALRLAFKHPDLFPVVAAIAPAIEYHELYHAGTPIDALYDSKEQCRQDTVPMHVSPNHYPPHIFFCIDPDDDDWLRGSERLHEKLGALGVPHEIDFTTRAGGHSWAYFERMAERAVRFVYGGLDHESRRLL